MVTSKQTLPIQKTVVNKQQSEVETSQALITNLKQTRKKKEDHVKELEDTTVT